MRIILLFLFLSLCCSGWAQSYDTIVTAYDSLYDEDSYNYEYEEEEDSLYAKATYTHKPGELPLKKHEQINQQNKKKFSKTSWKEIIGDTNYTEEKTEPQAQQDTRRSKAWDRALLKIIGFFIIIALIIVLIVFMLRNALSDEVITKKTNDADSLLGGDQHIDDIGEDDLEKLLQDALTKKDLRTAIRLYYIKLLKHLHAGEYIAWKKNKTNRDYADELSTSSFIREFRKVMIAYEVIWYGERTPSVREFETLQVNFNELHRQSPGQSHEK